MGVVRGIRGGRDPQGRLGAGPPHWSVAGALDV